MTKKSTKRALVGSVVAIVLCAVMLIGTTFAWFTDTASTGVNKIQAGNLKIDIVDEAGKSIKGEGLSFADVNGKTDILWEPGVTFKTPAFQIKNVGNLALKYKLTINGVTGDSKLLDVITFSVVGEDEKAVDIDTFEGNLKAGETAGDKLYIQGHMEETAGNEYQNLTLEGIGITVVATQYTEEYDSFNNTYDQDATYATPVTTKDEMEAALAKGENVVLQKDIELQSALQVEGNKTVSIDLNGHTVNAEGQFIVVTSGANVTLTGGTVEANYVAFVQDGGSLVVDSGSYTAHECVFAPYGNGTLTVNGGTFTSNDNAVVATNGSTGKGGNIIEINGGTFNGKITSAGYIACGVYVANSDTVTINGGTFNITDGVGVLMRAGETTIGKNVVINLENTGKITAGKVGDANINIDTPRHLVQDVRSGYPGAVAGFNIINNSVYELTTYE